MTRRGLAIYPSWRGVGLAAAGAPVVVGASFAGGGGWWVTSLGWVGACCVLLALDALMGPAVDAALAAPGVLEAGGRPGTAEVTVSARSHPRIELALETGPLIDVEPARQTVEAGAGQARFELVPRRRGRSGIEALHLRWPGPLGLVWKQRVLPVGQTVDVLPNVSAVREEAMRLFSRTRDSGAVVHRERTSSMEVHALREFQAGDDRRAISWRQSARHRALLVRDTRAERNRTITFAFDTGRLMCEPLGNGLPRIDHAINAALLMAYVGLKVGDRVGLFAFDAHPRVLSAAAIGIDAFGPLQRTAAAIDYTNEETNFTLGLSQLASRLKTRALVVLFTEVSDTTGARLMIESIGRLLERHVVLFVTFHDEELETLVRAEPQEAADVSSAVVAGGLLREREVVLGRMRRLGIDVLDVPARAAGPALLRRYLDLKREDRL